MDELRQLIESASSSHGPKVIAVLTQSAAIDADANVLTHALPFMQGLIVCLDRSPSSYESLFAEKGIRTSSIRYIDATSSGETGETITTGGDISDLTNVSIALFKTAESMKRLSSRPLFVLFDALSTLQWYNGVETVGRFLHTSNLRFRDMGVVQIYVLDAKSSIKAEIMKFCDKTIEI